MGRPSNAELAARAVAAEQPDAAATMIEGNETRPLEEFEKPVAKVKPETETPNGQVKIRVLPKGDGKIATGHFDRQLNAFTYHAKGDHLFVHPVVARAQEDNGLVEIVEE